jgi:nitrous oxide reductase
LNDKIRILKKYVSTHSGVEYNEDAGKRIAKIESEINLEEFNQLSKQANQLIEEQKFEDAHALYTRYIAQGASREYQNAAQQKIQEIAVLIEKRDFEEVANVFIKGEPDQKIKISLNYLKNHPDGKNKDQVQDLINEINSEYFIYVKKKNWHFMKKMKIGKRAWS